MIIKKNVSKVLCIWHVVTRFFNTLKIFLNLNSFPVDSILSIKLKPLPLNRKNSLILYSFFYLVYFESSSTSSILFLEIFKDPNLNWTQSGAWKSIFWRLWIMLIAISRVSAFTSGLNLIGSKNWKMKLSENRRSFSYWKDIKRKFKTVNGHK